MNPPDGDFGNRAGIRFSTDRCPLTGTGECRKSYTRQRGGVSHTPDEINAHAPMKKSHTPDEKKHTTTQDFRQKLRSYL